MVNEQKVNFTIDQISLLGPLIAGEILNAFYSALMLKQQKGINIISEIEIETLQEVLSKWSKIQILLEEAPKKKISL